MQIYITYEVLTKLMRWW